MDSIPKVYLSGPALSLLLYENLRCLYNQEGFLLGKKHARKVHKITDHDEPIETIQWEIHINSVVPCPKLASFYNASGDIMKDSVASILNDLYDDVVGWYTFKQNPDPPKLRLREKIVHKRLSAHFSTDAMEHFVWCINNKSNTKEKCTSKQSFIRYIDIIGTPGRHIAGFQELPLHIINLCDSKKNEYKSAGVPCDSLDTLILSLRQSHPQEDNNTLITRIEHSLQGEITITVKHISELEREVFALEQELIDLAHGRDITQTENDVDSSQTTDETSNNESDESSPKVMQTSACKQVKKRAISPVNGAANCRRDDNDRGDCHLSPSTSTVNVKSYSQAAKVKQ